MHPIYKYIFLLLLKHPIEKYKFNLQTETASTGPVMKP